MLFAGLTLLIWVLLWNCRKTLTLKIFENWFIWKLSFNFPDAPENLSFQVSWYADPDMPIMNLMDIGVCDKWFCNCMINMIPLKLQRNFRLILNYNVFDNLPTRAPKKTEDKSPNIKILDWGKPSTRTTVSSTDDAKRQSNIADVVKVHDYKVPKAISNHYLQRGHLRILVCSESLVRHVIQ